MYEEGTFHFALGLQRMLHSLQAEVLHAKGPLLYSLSLYANPLLPSQTGPHLGDLPRWSLFSASNIAMKMFKQPAILEEF